MPGKLTLFLPWAGECLPTETSEPPSLELCQKAVGGTVQVVELMIDGEAAQLLMNEDGKNLGMPLNRDATRLWFAEQRRRYGDNTMPDDDLDVIVGPALLLQGAARWT